MMLFILLKFGRNFALGQTFLFWVHDDPDEEAKHINVFK